MTEFRTMIKCKDHVRNSGKEREALSTDQNKKNPLLLTVLPHTAGIGSLHGYLFRLVHQTLGRFMAAEGSLCPLCSIPIVMPDTKFINHWLMKTR